MTKNPIIPTRINLNTTQETVTIPVADHAFAVVELVPDEASFTTYVAEVVYRISPETPWRSFTTAVTLTQASPKSEILGVTCVMQLGVRITTVQGSAALGNVYASGDTSYVPAGRIG